jgi:hypothetical protein
MRSEIAPWERSYHEPGGGDAFLFYTVFGDFGNLLREFRLSRSRYRSNGIPRGIDLWGCKRPDDADYLDGFLEGPVGKRLEERSPNLFDSVRKAPAGIVVRGSIPDPETLNYLRDVVGVLTYLLDNGGAAILDLLTLEWWDPDGWRQRIFDPHAAVPTHHVSILMSREEGQAQDWWFHTRGMRKFGRPDLSVRNVPAEHREAVVDMFNRFITLQALGGMVPEGQEIQMADLPAGLTCHHAGDMDDPDFNNIHLEIRWPGLRR